ncbi:cuticle protein 63-like [Pollicipes pollicipes]|uniref:cuticle protein 63-like n=1 Tax=Pollicipes pollicipes TaxID=41117 RepID=UPI00188589F0|nr:cuticle protein 63-like [Pollicipes pollicipes]
MFRLIVLACVLAVAFAGLLPLGYSGLGYSGLGYSGLGYSGLAHGYAAAPAAYSAAAFPTYETVSHSVDIAAEPCRAARLRRQVLSR